MHINDMITNFLKRVPQPVPEEIKIQLNKYTCGYDGSIKVCCPSGPIPIKIKDTYDADADALLENPPPPPDIANHKNYYLLPEECGYLGNPDKIRNGIDAKLNEFPWMALLSYNTSK
ncbi:hypothetical protein NQ314_003808 [Rhamnusium bicolor]|uniref:Uncharacterized protein n=1 Tax=Rhamnusium bicolor TaxID=1586634 RepID=A0AAV8ZKV6_9CUCU|nr:hypothetical protein NQ314_003808 [Rhamnusium bicolor]